MGVDELPAFIRESNILSGDNIRKLATVTSVPMIDPNFEDTRLKNIVQYFAINPDEMEKELQYYAKELVEIDNIAAAWQVLLTLT